MKTDPKLSINARPKAASTAPGSEPRPPITMISKPLTVLVAPAAG